jgi:hypothetical protein
VVTLPLDVPLGGGHRFAGQWYEGLHPMALNNSVGAFAVLTTTGRVYEVAYRYESWVQYRSRLARPRVDLSGLAAELNELESEGRWVFDGVGALTPRLHLLGADESVIDRGDFEKRLLRHLSESPAAWNPFG